MKLTTTNLRLPRPRAWWNLPTPLAAAICIFALLAIAFMVGKIRNTPAVVAQPTPAIIIFATSAPAAPTATPAPPTPDERVYQELAALREQVAQLQAAQQAVQPQPEVIYQPVYVASQPEQAAPTIEPSAPPIDIRTQAILDRGAWAAQAATAQAGR